MIFEYNLQTAYQQSIDVVDIGNTALKCISENYSEYYIILKTVMGKVNILKLGPIMPDISMLLDGYSLTYKKINYKEAAIQKEVNQFINDPRKEINSIEEITEYEAFQILPDIQTLFEEA